MPFRSSFDCLWCGRPHAVRGSSDLEGWAQLCPECLGRAGDNGFLRARLRTALDERAAGHEPTAAPGSDEQGAGAAAGNPRAAPAAGRRLAGTDMPLPGSALASGAERDLPVVREAAAVTLDGEASAGAASTPLAERELDEEMRRYYAARAGEYDDWYLRRGRYAHGPVHDQAWQADLEAAAEWLEAQPVGGEIVELAAGTGWWSPILAGKGDLWLYDAVPEPLERARARLVAHRLRAHLHLRDAWTEPDRRVDTLFAGFWLSHVSRSRLPGFLGLCRRWLRDGGTFLFIDSCRDAQSGAVDQPRSTEPDVARRRLADGREFTIPKVFHEPTELREILVAAGFSAASVTTTARFFLLGRATA